MKIDFRKHRGPELHIQPPALSRFEVIRRSKNPCGLSSFMQQRHRVPAVERSPADMTSSPSCLSLTHGIRSPQSDHHASRSFPANFLHKKGRLNARSVFRIELFRPPILDMPGRQHCVFLLQKLRMPDRAQRPGEIRLCFRSGWRLAGSSTSTPLNFASTPNSCGDWPGESSTWFRPSPPRSDTDLVSNRTEAL